MIIPDGFTIGLAIEGVILSALVPALHGQHSGLYPIDSLRSLSASLVGLVAGSGIVLWIALLAEAVLKKEAMGFGDVKFVGAIGTFCGWHGAVFSIFGGAAFGTLWLGRRHRLAEGFRLGQSAGAPRAGDARRPSPPRSASACTCPSGRCWRRRRALLSLPAGLGRRLVRQPHRAFLTSSAPSASRAWRMSGLGPELPQIGLRDPVRDLLVAEGVRGKRHGRSAEASARSGAPRRRPFSDSRLSTRKSSSGLLFSNQVRELRWEAKRSLPTA